MTNKKEISMEEFERLYMQPREDWDFSKFKIKCAKCGSENVEFAGKTETVCGYYGDIDFEHKIIVKCHDCGNAQAIRATDSDSNNYCPDCD